MIYFFGIMYTRAIHIDPLGQPTVGIIVLAHVLPYVRTSPLFKVKQNKITENNVRYWRDCGFGRVDHW